MKGGEIIMKKITDIYNTDSFEMANFEVAVDEWAQYKDVDIPQARELLKSIANTINGVYVSGKDKGLNKPEIAEVVYSYFKDMNKQTISKMRVYSQNYDAIMTHLDKVDSLSVNVDRMVQLWAASVKAVKKVEANTPGVTIGGIPFPATTLSDSPYPLSEFSEEDKKPVIVGANPLKTGFETPVEVETSSNFFMRSAKTFSQIKDFVKGFNQDELDGYRKGLIEGLAVVDLEIEARVETPLKVVSI